LVFQIVWCFWRSHNSTAFDAERASLSGHVGELVAISSGFLPE